MGWMSSEGSGWLRLVSILVKPDVGDVLLSSILRLEHQQQSLVAVPLYKLKTGSSLQIVQKLRITL